MDVLAWVTFVRAICHCFQCLSRKKIELGDSSHAPDYFETTNSMGFYRKVLTGSLEAMHKTSTREDLFGLEIFTALL